jgi:DNA-directed RNA polymerase subunit M/transcription elongation factor TFIIS
MDCPRCQSFMTEESATDHGGEGCSIWLWACHSCGERLDDTIRFHRIWRKAETVEERNARIMQHCRQEFMKLSLTDLERISS